MVALFSSIVFLTYGFFYILPALILTRITHATAWRVNRSGSGSWRMYVVYAIAALLTGATWVFLLADGWIYDLYSFHINGFVINLVTTPGGIESMGGSTGATVLFSLMILALFLVAAAILWATHRATTLDSKCAFRLRLRFLIIAFLFLATGERIGYGFSSLWGYTPVLTAAHAFPLYTPVTFGSLAEKLGLQPDAGPEFRFGSDISRLNYPLHALTIEPPAHPYNIVWMIAESLRADMLTPEIMPATWKFAGKAYRFTRHYSGSNSTRMGVFSLFYGLYGNFWFPFLESRQGPVLFKVLQDQGYQGRFFSSQGFTYPEFDKTVFASFPKEVLQSFAIGPGWVRDQRNITDLLSFLEDRDRSRPFMTYMFFESPHARYYFPPESVIRTPYLEEFNYATMDRKRDMPLIFNRYVNSVHHLDKEIARVLDYLVDSKLLDDTIVIITGDHGEEFMEHGHWGHGSSFVDEQTLVPMVLWMPGTGSGTVDRMTSHLDVVPTILPMFGVRNPATDYSLGIDMLGQAQRDYTVVDHWRTLGYIGKDYKASFDMDNAHYAGNQVTKADDSPVKDGSEFYVAHQADLVQIMNEIARFSAK